MLDRHRRVQHLQCGVASPGLRPGRRSRRHRLLASGDPGRRTAERAAQRMGVLLARRPMPAGLHDGMLGHGWGRNRMEDTVSDGAQRDCRGVLPVGLQLRQPEWPDVHLDRDLDDCHHRHLQKRNHRGGRRSDTAQPRNKRTDSQRLRSHDPYRMAAFRQAGRAQNHEQCDN